MEGFGPFAYCRGRGLVPTAYLGQGGQGFALTQPFQAMGAAAHLSDPSQTIFHFGHLRRHGQAAPGPQPAGARGAGPRPAPGFPGG
jgi:hypothetical protein